MDNQFKQKVICVVSPGKNVYSETFIRAHIERLPAKVIACYGGFLPRYYDDDKLIFPLEAHPVLLNLTKAIFRVVKKEPGIYLQKESLRRFFLKNKVEVVLAEFGPTGVAVMEVCKEARVPLIVHFHGYDAYHHSVLEEYHLAYKRMFTMASKVIAGSRDMEQQLFALGALREKIFYNPCGVDISFFSDGNPSSALPLFLAVGRFVDKKAPHLTILAFKKVIETLPDARMIMIGDGPLLEVCKELVKALGISQTVEFLEVRSPAEVATIMRKARAFVQHSVRTSYGDSEGTCVAVLEAQATGLPVVATRHAGIKDVIIEGQTGLLVDEGDIKGMAEHMIQLAKDSQLACQLGKAARERICSEFSMEKSINKLWHIIETAINKS